MKNIFALIAAAVFLLSASCRKQDCRPDSSWQIEGVTHPVNSKYYIITGPAPAVQMLFVRDGDSTSRSSNVDFGFDTLPAVSGDYTLGAYAGPQQIQILSTSYLGGDRYAIYSTTGSGHSIAHVTVSNGKMGIDIPELWLKNTSGSDSVKFTAHISR